MRYIIFGLITLLLVGVGSASVNVDSKYPILKYGPGAANEKDFEDYINLVIAGDQKAANSMVSTGILAGTWSYFAPGDIVYVTDTHEWWNGLIQVRLEGDYHKWWVYKTMVDSEAT